MDTTELLKNKIESFLEDKGFVAKNEEVLFYIVDEVFERWGSLEDDPSEIDSLEFEVFSDEDGEDFGSIWVHWGKRDISFSLENGECTGSGMAL